MTDRTSLNFGIENKPDIEQIMGSSRSIPENELHVQKGTSYAKKLKGIDSDVSVALVAKANGRFCCKSYTVGYIGSARLVFNKVQAKPLMVNHEMIERAVKEFRPNDAYQTFEIEIVCPTMDLFEFTRSRGTLSPFASVDSAYRG